MSKPIKIAFIGKKQGTNHLSAKKFLSEWALERPRKQEEEGLKASGLEKTNSLESADIVYSRFNPEHINNRSLKRIRQAENRANPNSFHINRSDSYEFYSDKAKCFSRWNENDLNCPAFISSSPWLSTNKLTSSIKSMLEEYGAIYFRTSNEDSGKGLFYLDHTAQVSDIKRCIRKLRFRCLTNKVSGSKLMTVQPLANRDNNSISHVYRAHVIGDTILGGYALVGKKAIIHSSDQTMALLGDFIEYNRAFEDIIANPAHKRTLLAACKSLGLTTAAIEFFHINDSLYFLEANPKWGGLHKFGDQAFTDCLIKNIEQNKLPFIKKWLNPTIYYKDFYQEITAYFMASLTKKLRK